MSESIKLKLSDDIEQFVREKTGVEGEFSSPEDFIADLIRREYEEEKKWKRLNAEIDRALALPEEAYVETTAEEFLRALRERENG